MASPKAYPGYQGIAVVGGDYYRCNDFSLNVQQDVLFYNHTIGLNDTIPTDSATKGEEVGTIQTQRKYLRPSPVGMQGGFSFPAAIQDDAGELNFKTIFDYAKYGNYFDIDFHHYCNVGRTFINCRVNTFNFSITSSDIITIAVDVLAGQMTNNDSHLSYIRPQKLVTWDLIDISISGDAGTLAGIKDGIQSFEFNINNNAAYIYTARPFPAKAVTDIENLWPYDIRLGMQEVTGSITVYLKQGIDFITTTTGPAIISLSCGGYFSTDINVVFKPREMPGTVGAYVLTIPFVGIDKAFGS